MKVRKGEEEEPDEVLGASLIIISEDRKKRKEGRVVTQSGLSPGNQRNSPQDFHRPRTTTTRECVCVGEQLESHAVYNRLNTLKCHSTKQPALVSSVEDSSWCSKSSLSLFFKLFILLPLLTFVEALQANQEPYN